jgi:hypothetical protein
MSVASASAPAPPALRLRLQPLPAAAEPVFEPEVESEASVAGAPTLEEVLGHIDALRKMVKAAIKGARKRRTPEQIAADAAKPKREQSEAGKAWMDYVAAVHEEMKTADPTVKRPAAMAEAKRRRDAGDAAAPKKADDAESKASRESEKSVKREAKAAEKAAKAAAAAEAKAVKEEEKAAKAAAAAEAKAAKEEEKAAKAAAKASKLASQATKTKAAPAAASAAATEDEDLVPFLHKGKYYFRSCRNECWEAGTDGQLGKWTGIYDAASNTFKAAAEPKLSM